MRGAAFFVIVIALTAIAAGAAAQVKGFTPVTREMLANPSPDDWLMYSRTYDAQRYSPLNEINSSNVNRLEQVWTKELASGSMEIIPIEYRGVLYVEAPGSVLALDATNGSVIWEYKRGGASRAKTMAIAEDMIIYATSDNTIVALDAATGALRWETPSAGLSSGTIVFENKVITGRTCSGNRSGCYIAAHDVKTGAELWKFFTAAGPDDPLGDASWGGAPEAKRTASTWGLGGSFDPSRRTIYWGVANPTPNTRAARHDGKVDAIPRTAPADLYSNSTVALDIETGKLKWYYQHLPGDDWDQDYTNERILIHTKTNPNPQFLKWINPDIRAGEERDIVVNVGEGGGIFALDRQTGQFLWANPFPYDGPNFLISHIDGKTGKSTINWDLVLKEPGEQHIICAYNTKSYWPMSYHPGTNSLYIPYADDCLDMTRGDPPPADAEKAPEGAEGQGQRGTAGARREGGSGGGQRGGTTRGRGDQRTAVRRPGSDPNRFGGIAKVNVSTGELTRIYEGPASGNGAMLSTAGNLLFWGDIARNFRAFDADTGKILWQTTLNGPIQTSTITYRVNGKQYVCVMTGLGLMTSSLYSRSGVDADQPHATAIHVFALP
ncbi:MAG TPA: PQQ-binding-like beta-propeller repeat protein [Terriglobia bacterium]|nr:PQQ-binding-like beta-propeller repeat protein [Terriglobia bacterium]